LQALILAAGKSTRLQSILKDQPKCLIKIGGTSLIEHHLKVLESLPASEVVIVIGYEGDKIKSECENLSVNIPIRYVTNDEYASTGSGYSLFRGLKDLNPQNFFMWMDADLMYEKKMFLDFFNDETPFALVGADPTPDLEAVKVTVHNNRIIDFGKTISASHGTLIGEAVGIVCGDSRFYKSLMELISSIPLDMMKSLEWEEIFLRFCGTANVGIKLTHRRWIEIDTEGDLKRARKMFIKKEAR